MRVSFLTLYIARRICISLIVLMGISLIAFWMSYLLPSDPVTSRYPDITADQREEIRRQMGLDQPLLVQYGRYMLSVFRGEFGTSYNTGNSVSEDLRIAFRRRWNSPHSESGSGFCSAFPWGSCRRSIAIARSIM
jgi:peptide/nickel transport system permease protein